MFFKHSKKNIIVIGANGMLGYDVIKHLDNLRKNAASYVGEVLSLNEKQIDITQPYALFDILNSTSVKYDYVVNCAAMTDTSKIETDQNYRNAAYAVNALGVQNLAKACAFFKMKLIHISTDYVYSQFSAKGKQLPYESISAFNESNSHEFPVNVYGMQKLLGEKYAKESLPENDCTILRTSWLYGNHNHKSFVHKFLKNFDQMYIQHLAAGNTEAFQFQMTQNEYSIPTCTTALAKMISNVIKHNLHGTFAACGMTSSSGCSQSILCKCSCISRKQWAEEILRCWLMEEMPDKWQIIGVDRDTLAPKFSHMDNSAFTYGMYMKLYDNVNQTWQQDLQQFMSEYADDIVKWLWQSEEMS